MAFVLKPLPYPYNALEPYIDTRTMEIHHTKHEQAYVDNLNKALAGYPRYANWSVERLIANVRRLPTDIQIPVLNNAGGIYNHDFFWSIMHRPDDVKMPIGALLNAINRSFGSFDKFKQEFRNAALSVFGSGYAWLVVRPSGRLEIITTPNQITPINMNVTPILVIDVWEHAYYLKHQNRRAEYIDDWFNVVNWEQVPAYYNGRRERR